MSDSTMHPLHRQYLEIAQSPELADLPSEEKGRRLQEAWKSLLQEAGFQPLGRMSIQFLREDTQP